MHSEGVRRHICRPQQAPKTSENTDPNPERFSFTEETVHGALSAHKQIYDEAKKQTTTEVFLGRMTSPREAPQAGPSGGVPEEGSVVIGGDSSVRVIALETFQGDETWRWQCHDGKSTADERFCDGHLKEQSAACPNYQRDLNNPALAFFPLTTGSVNTEQEPGASVSSQVGYVVSQSLSSLTQ